MLRLEGNYLIEHLFKNLSNKLKAKKKKKNLFFKFYYGKPYILVDKRERERETKQLPSSLLVKDPHSSMTSSQDIFELSRLSEK